MTTIENAINDLNKLEFISEENLTQDVIQAEEENSSIGITPGEIIILLKQMQEMCDKKRQNLLIKLEVKPGDIVYQINKNRNIVSTFEVTCVSIEKNDVYYKWKLISGITTGDNFRREDINQTVYLNENDAKNALDKEN